MKKHAQKQSPLSKPHPILFIVLIAAAIPLVAITAFLMSFDLNNYRGAIEKVTKEETGRTIKLKGPLSWSVSLRHGVSLTVHDITIDNTSWASRPDMAHIGEARLHVDLLDLTRKRLNIIAFEVTQMDVQLETASNGAVNWNFTKPSVATTEKIPDVQPPSPANETAPVSIHVKQIKITDSHFGFKNKDGKLSLVDVPDLSVLNDRSGLHLHYKGSVAETPVEIDLTGGRFELITQTEWPFNMRILYDQAKLDARGNLSDAMKKVVIDEFRLTSGPSDVAGNLTVTLEGARPRLTGKAHSKHLASADLRLGKSADKATEDRTTTDDTVSKDSQKIFSETPLNLEGLKSVDAHLDLTIDELVAGLTTAQNVKAQVDLEGGHLNLTPVSAVIAGGQTDFTLKIDATSPTALVATTLKAPALDMAQLFKLGGMESAISGKTNVAIDVTSSGRTPHDFARHANGKINLLMDTGTVSPSALRNIAGGLISLFAPGVGSLSSPGINCLAAHYVITNGLMTTKGLLLDTDITTIAGTGYVNLADEHISMAIFTRPKGLGLTSMIPPMHITGNLASPSFNLDAASAVQKLTGLLTQASTAGDGVPTLVATTSRNVCDATLENPHYNAPAKPLVPGEIPGLHDAVKNVGGKLLKGLGSSLLGN